jgi:predicted phage gp36 major capsid-like protein
MAESSGVENAIRELQQEQKRIQDVITMLKRIHSQRAAMASGGARPRKRLSAKARRRISEAAKKRWAALRSVKGKS